MAGLLDFANTDEGMQGLGLLSAAAPSMAPMNLAGRIAMAAQGYQGMKDNRLKQMEAEQVFQMKNIALQQQQQEWAMQYPLLQKMAAQLSGAPQALESAAQPDAQPAPVPYEGAPRDMTASVPMPRSQPQALQAMPQQAPQGGSMFPNVPNNVALPTAAFGGMKALLPLLTKYNEPTEMQRNSNWMGISAGERADGARRELAGKGLMNLKPDGTVYDPVKGPLFTAPDPGRNSFLTWQGGVPSMSGIAGGNAVIQSAARAAEAGKGEVLPVTAYDKGVPVFTSRTAAATGGASANPAGNAPSGNGRYPSQASAPSGPLSPVLSPAAEAAGKEAGLGSGKQYVADNAQANGFGARKYTLQQALSNLENANVGPGSKTANNVKSFLLAQTPLDMGKYLPGVDPEKIQSYDEANKYLIQYAMGKASALGEGTDAKLATTLSGNANTEISKLAATDVVKANLGLEDMQNAQIKAFNKSGQPSENYQKFATQWNSGVDPRVFVWNYATPINKTRIAEKMDATERATFFKQYNAALQAGYISRPKQ